MKTRLLLAASLFAFVSCVQNHGAMVQETPSCTIDTLGHFRTPETWTRFEAQSYSVCVPPTVELRKSTDEYTKRLEALRLQNGIDQIVIFQQKGLGENDPEALSRYCRVMIQFIKGAKGDNLKKDECAPITYEDEQTINELVSQDVAALNITGTNQVTHTTPQIRWIRANGQNAVQIKYRRGGIKEDYTANVTWYLLQNDDKFVKLIVSYREQEGDLWASDFPNIIKTFKWNNDTPFHISANTGTKDESGGIKVIKKHSGDFRTYSNKYFSVDYPNDWLFIEKPNIMTDVYIGYTDERRIGFTVLHFPSNESLQDVNNEGNTNYKMLDGAKILECKKTTVNGITAYRNVYQRSQYGLQVKEILYLFKSKGEIYSFRFGSDPKLVDSNKDVIDRIVASIKIKPTATK